MFYSVETLNHGTIVINGPESSLLNDTYNSYEYRFTQVSAIIANANPAFDNTVTLLANNDNTKTYLLGLGFTSVYSLQDLANEKLTFNWGAYITIGNAGLVSYYDSNDVLIATDIETCPASAAKSLLTSIPDAASASVILTLVDHGGANPYPYTIAAANIYITNISATGARLQFSGYNDGAGARYVNARFNPLSSSAETKINDIKTWWDLQPAPPVPPSDPYADGGYSGGGGGDGSFNLQNDSIDFPNLPTLSAVDTGLVSIYTPSLTQLKSLATFLWNANPTDVDWWKKLVANPLDLILGLSIVPVSVPAGSAQTIKVGLIDTGVSVTKAASQFVTVDCGSVTIQKNCGGSALDYSPFTKFSLYLPFIGTRTISCDDIMGRTVHVKYNVDLLSGGCTAMVKITGGPEDNQLNAILYQYSGACAISIPLTGETFTNMITSTIQLAASIGATVATGGAAAGVTAASAANSLMSMKPIIERAGGVSGAAGQLGIMQPYLIAEVPRQSVPENCNAFTGYPSNIKATIGDLTGYTEVDIVYLKGIEATQAELDELETVLKGGFII